MIKKQILVVATANQQNAELLEWTGLENKYQFSFAGSEEKAIEISHQCQFDIAVIDMTTANVDLKKLAAVLPILHDEIALILYKGESAAELESMAQTVFKGKRNERMKHFIILDSSGMNSFHELPHFSAN